MQGKRWTSSGEIEKIKAIKRILDNFFFWESFFTSYVLTYLDGLSCFQGHSKGSLAQNFWPYCPMFDIFGRSSQASSLGTPL